MKVKEVQIGDQPRKIGSLTIDQYEQLVLTAEENKGIASKDFISKYMLPVVAASLKNAEANSGKWFAGEFAVPPDLRSELDFGELNELYIEVLKLSGLKPAKQPGEAEAAASQ